MVIDVGWKRGGGLVPEDEFDSAVLVGSWLVGCVAGLVRGVLDGRDVTCEDGRGALLPMATGPWPRPPPWCSSEGITVGASTAPAMTTTALAAVTRAWFIFRRLARR